ncbi:MULTISPECIES: ORF6N domain-containing protein [Acinetobacter]|uniref:ORF6N domain-containing protein n=1 Tax=Acinetobacter chengduensis TaxID=2420890 RepID=A0ABX9TR33_9GAMM|nr:MULTISPECIES: ORF6N domain-containing protein [Acinetobacter]MBI1453644.1 ORF6N domain-containing protein [Acinetobacter sp. FL51]RLL17020.1 ORF6N domain-containing protein [Acinetobacter chengduensis]
MTNLAQINDTQVSIVNFKSTPVLTTEQLANFYGTDVNNIKVNLSRNKSRFIEGKHFFKITGQELKDFVSSLKLLTDDLRVTKSNSQNLQPSQRGVQISSKTRVLTLWTERGAARHAKMLDTDQAWDIFEQLEDCYFHRQEILAKTHKSERTALHDAHAMLVAKTKHLNSSDAWKLIHQRFNVDHIEDIPYDAIPVAVEYVHHLIALYSNSSKQGSLFDKDTYELVREFAESVLSQNFMMQDVWQALMLINKKDMMYYSRYVIDSNTMARKVSIALGFKTKKGEPLIDGCCQTINFVGGAKFTGVNPKWFNAPAW